MSKDEYLPGKEKNCLLNSYYPVGNFRYLSSYNKLLITGYAFFFRVSFYASSGYPLLPFGVKGIRVPSPSPLRLNSTGSRSNEEIIVLLQFSYNY
jgi:hypothetical protein